MSELPPLEEDNTDKDEKPRFMVGTPSEGWLTVSAREDGEDIKIEVDYGGFGSGDLTVLSNSDATAGWVVENLLTQFQEAESTDDIDYGPLREGLESAF